MRTASGIIRTSTPTSDFADIDLKKWQVAFNLHFGSHKQDHSFCINSLHSSAVQLQQGALLGAGLFKSETSVCRQRLVSTD